MLELASKSFQPLAIFHFEFGTAQKAHMSLPFLHLCRPVDWVFALGNPPGVQLQVLQILFRNSLN
jgi:hypothetical protein